MKIAICDDCQNDIEYLKRIILECEICLEKVEFYEFYTGELLLSDITDFDLVFLDIKLEGVSGTRTAELIRLQNPLVPIVFYTGYDVMATEVIKVHPLNYLKKGNDIKEHRQIISDIFIELNKQKNLPNLVVQYRGKILVLHLYEILFISILDKGTEICITNEKKREISGTREKAEDYRIRSGVKLEEYYKQLKNYGFIYAKKSYIINARFIVARLKDSVILKENYELTVARSKKNQFDDQLMEFWGKDVSGREEKE